MNYEVGFWISSGALVLALLGWFLDVEAFKEALEREKQKNRLNRYR